MYVYIYIYIYIYIYHKMLPSLIKCSISCTHVQYSDLLNNSKNKTKFQYRYRYRYRYIWKSIKL